MTEIARSVPLRRASVGQAWQSFWFRPQPMFTLGLVRIGFGVLAVIWGLWLLSMRNGLMGADGVTPHAAVGRAHLGDL